MVITGLAFGNRRAALDTCTRISEDAGSAILALDWLPAPHAIEGFVRRTATTTGTKGLAHACSDVLPVAVTAGGGDYPGRTRIIKGRTQYITQRGNVAKSQPFLCDTRPDRSQGRR